MTLLTQISQRTGSVVSPAYYDPPAIALDLEPGEYVVSWELKRGHNISRRTMTGPSLTRWTWEASIATPLQVPWSPDAD